MTQFDNRWIASFNYGVRENVSASKCAVSPYKKREITFDSDIRLHSSGGIVAMRSLVFVQTSRIVANLNERRIGKTELSKSARPAMGFLSMARSDSEKLGANCSRFYETGSRRME